MPAGCANVRNTRVLKETHCVCKQNFLEKVQRKVEAELKRIDGEGRHPHLRTHSTKERKKIPKKKGEKARVNPGERQGKI